MEIDGLVVHGVLLDLRSNASGLLDEAVRVSDEFLDGGVIVSTRGRDGVVLREASAEHAPLPRDFEKALAALRLGAR